MLASIGRYVLCCIGCSLLGAVTGAVLGGLAALPFFPPAGSLIGLILGAIGGFVAGLVGALFGGTPGFRIGGVVGAITLTTIFPFIVFVLFIPPVLAIGTGFLFGLYLDKQLNETRPRFFLAGLVKDILSTVTAIPSRAKILCGCVVSGLILIACFVLWWRMDY